MSARAPAGLDDLDRPDELELPSSSAEPSPGSVATVPGVEVEDDAELMTISIPKPEPSTRIGIGLRADTPERAVVHTVAAGTPAEGRIEPFDELFTVAGEPVSSAVHAVQLIREFPGGELQIQLARRSGLSEAAVAVQNSMRNAMATREGLVRRTIVKPTPDAVLGLSFAPEYHFHSVIKVVKEGGLAAQSLDEGDVVRRLNGTECANPADTARLLRESFGRLELLVMPGCKVDVAEIEAAEQEEAAHQAALEEQYRAEERQRRLEAGARGGGCGSHDEAMGGLGGDPDDDYEDEEGEEDGEEDFDEYDDDDYDEAERSRMNAALPPRAAQGLGTDPFPSPQRPGARRLPPSLGGLSPHSLSNTPQGGHVEPPSPVPNPQITSGTRMGGPPLAKSAKPEGWREWLKARKGSQAATVPAPRSPRSAHPAYSEQRV